MENHYISWWNVENLFDEKNAPEVRRPDSIRRKISSDLSKWTVETRDKKIKNLAWVLSKINDQKGPDILGICEIENKFVLELLVNTISIPNREYGIIHSNSSDKRGIDVAFIYDKNKYIFNHDEFFEHIIVKRYATREIIQTTLTTLKGNELILIGNHWPSRSAGQYESEPFRIIAAETLSYFVESIQRIKGKDSAIIVMGDFNDEPFDRSLEKYALSSRNRKKVSFGKNPNLYNLMWPLIGKGEASYVYSSSPMMIDQFMVSKGIISNRKYELDEQKVKVEKFDGMTKGRYDKPVRFGQSSPNLSGFSDHLPISFVLGEK
ncbi:MAG: endonuclease/exonuclease/phosphatase family protein [Bacteroidota bacterium]